MIKVYTSATCLDDSGVVDMVHMLYYASTGKWNGPYNRETNTWDPYPYDFFMLDFSKYGHEDCFYDEKGYYNQDLDYYYDKETLKQWQKEQSIKFAPIHIKKLSFYPVTLECERDLLCIEIESDNDDEVEKLFTFMSAFGDGGHSYGGTIKINDIEDSHLGSFGYDGDGCDHIYKIEKVNEG